MSRGWCGVAPGFSDSLGAWADLCCITPWDFIGVQIKESLKLEILIFQRCTPALSICTKLFLDQAFEEKNGYRSIILFNMYLASSRIS